MSARHAAILAALLLALSLWLRPVMGRMGDSAGDSLPAPTRTGDLERATERSVPRDAPEPLGAVAAAILEATNRERQEAGLSLLKPEGKLAEIATEHCDAMLTQNFFDHVDPDGLGPADRVARGHRTLIGTSAENIWMGSGFPTDDAEALGAEIVESWMGSRGHRENILRPELTHLGVGVSRAGDELRATQLFGRVMAYLSEPLPRAFRQGTELRLVSEPFAGWPRASRVDLFSEGRPRWGPAPIETARFDAEPGSYLLRFYFPRRDGYTIAHGPAMEITP